VASAITFIAWAESLETMNYYDILRVPTSASAEEIQKAFHDLSLRCHPDRFVEEPPDVAEAASTVFKRLVEAYNCLRRPALRQRYDAELHKGQVKFDEQKLADKPKFEQRTLYMIAKDARAKQFAAKADRFLSMGKLEEARIQLISACQNDPANAELKERLDALYEALMLEPP
jgi:curved DNA-binding protein CbpA